jgi:hypothetical protein
MLPDNCRALNLTKKMGFQQEYLRDGTIKGTLNLTEETTGMEHPQQRNYPLAEMEKEQTPTDQKTKSETIKSETETVQQ